MTQHANECDLSSMKLEDHLVMLAMIGTQEEDLRSALYRLREPKWQEVKTVVLNYERGRNTQLSNETAYYANKGKFDQRQKKPAQRNSQQNRKRQCFRCGDFTHNSKTCKLPLSTVCNKCKKKGHLSNICFGGQSRERSRLVTEHKTQPEDWEAQITEDESSATAKSIKHTEYVYRASSPPFLI